MWYEEITRPYFNPLILREIEILRPDYLVFFTGPDSDRYISDIFGNPAKKPVAGFSEGELCEFVIPNVKKAVRTYHPGYLYRQTNRPKDDFFAAIADALK